MANVLLIGATGFVGSAVLNELVERGHKVTAVVRNVEKIAKNDLVTAVKEDVANVEAIAKLAEGKDAIISAYNPGWLNPEIATLITENYPKILEAAKKSGVKRLLIVVVLVPCSALLIFVWLIQVLSLQRLWVVFVRLATSISIH